MHMPTVVCDVIRVVAEFMVCRLHVPFSLTVTNMHFATTLKVRQLVPNVQPKPTNHFPTL